MKKEVIGDERVLTITLARPEHLDAIKLGEDDVALTDAELLLDKRTGYISSLSSLGLDSVRPEI